MPASGYANYENLKARQSLLAAALAVEVCSFSNRLQNRISGSAMTN